MLLLADWPADDAWTNTRLGNRSTRFPHPQTSDGQEANVLKDLSFPARSAGEEGDGTTV